MNDAARNLPIPITAGLILSTIALALLLIGLFLFLRHAKNRPEAYLIVAGVLLVAASLVARGVYVFGG